MVVVVVLKYDVSWWSVVLDDANVADELESFSRVRVVMEVIVVMKLFGEFKCLVFDDFVC